DVLVICEQIEENNTYSSTRGWKVSIHTASRPVRALLMTGEAYSSNPEETHPYILNFRRGPTLPIIPGGYSIEFYGEVDLAQVGISSRDEMFITVDEIQFIYARTGENIPQERVSYSNCSLTNEE
ncbi:MAG: hypothetical protein KC662_04620, partial [Candidatus Magasanikbacteria bacterium]|nr:hypothetical protein [Candidatus Magasanikbacteria bacterium]